MKKLETTVTVFKYEAEDGTIFTTEKDCIHYELLLGYTSVYLVVAPHHNRDTRAQSIFSTVEKAEEWIKQYVNNSEDPYGGLAVQRVPIDLAVGERYEIRDRVNAARSLPYE